MNTYRVIRDRGLAPATIEPLRLEADSVADALDAAMASCLSFSEAADWMHTYLGGAHGTAAPRDYLTRPLEDSDFIHVEQTWTGWGRLT